MLFEDKYFDILKKTWVGKITALHHRITFLALKWEPFVKICTYSFSPKWSPQKINISFSQNGAKGSGTYHHWTVGIERPSLLTPAQTRTSSSISTQSSQVFRKVVDKSLSQKTWRSEDLHILLLLCRVTFSSLVVEYIRKHVFITMLCLLFHFKLVHIIVCRHPHPFVTH